MRIRLVRLRPYRRGCGPSFSLELHEVPGQSERIGYTLRQHDHGKAVVIFDDRDFRPSPLHAWDSDQTVASIMGFLTLRLGDTDRDYFANYSAEQIEFRDKHAEALACEVCARFEAKEAHKWPRNPFNTEPMPNWNS